MREKNEQGAIVVEATIALSAFMFIIVTLLSIVNICFAQAKIGVAINTAAKEISQYSYLYGLTGLNQKQARLYAGGQDAKARMDNTLEGVNELYNAAAGLGSIAKQDAYNVQDAYDAFDLIESGAAGAGTIQTEMEKIAEDPKAFILGFGKLFANGAIEEGKSRLVAAPLAKVMSKKNLVNSSDSGYSSSDCNSFLKSLGVVPKNGSYIDGLDFTDSVIFLNGTDEIKIVVNYEIKVIDFFNLEYKMPFTQCATTRAWFTGVSTANDAPGGEGEDKEDDRENEEKTLTDELANDYARQATNENGDPTKVVLGGFAYNNGTEANQDLNATDSFYNVAQRYGATYFNLETWDTVKEEYGEENMWKINEAFLQQQYDKGVTFYLTEDPNNTSLGAYLKKEIQWLKDHGYSFEKNEATGLWRAYK